MPQRRDKKAELTLLAYYYDLDLIFVDGVNGRQERPDVLNGDKQGQWGAAEAHASAWRRMLADGASTALFMEDDVDFSVYFKDQLLRIQEPLALLSSMIDGKPSYRSPTDPWNSQHWDQIWLGEETERWWSEDILAGNVTGLPYAVFRDPTRGQLHHGVYHDGEYAEVLDAYNLPQHFDEADAHKRLRVVQASVETFALSGYALSAPGARKALYKNAHKSWIDHIDFDLKELGTRGFSRQFTVVPPIFNQRKPLEGEDSDRTGESASSHVIAGTLGRTSTINNTAREHLFDNLVRDRQPIFIPV
jgi:GR25 family glycosyltransferase involved in LPS biosynthesis